MLWFLDRSGLGHLRGCTAFLLKRSWYHPPMSELHCFMSSQNVEVAFPARNCTGGRLVRRRNGVRVVGERRAWIFACLRLTLNHNNPEMESQTQQPGILNHYNFMHDKKGHLLCTYSGNMSMNLIVEKSKLDVSCAYKKIETYFCRLYSKIKRAEKKKSYVAKKTRKKKGDGTICLK